MSLSDRSYSDNYAKPPNYYVESPYKSYENYESYYEDHEYYKRDADPFAEEMRRSGLIQFSKRDAESFKKRDAESFHERDDGYLRKRDADSLRKRDANSSNKRDADSSNKRDADSSLKKRVSNGQVVLYSVEFLTHTFDELEKWIDGITDTDHPIALELKDEEATTL
ncbi:14039_t:CDS:2, partial [Gigaspora rosea]